MKILVLSDSHNKFKMILKMYNNEKPDCVFFLGDHSKDGIELSYIDDKIPFYIVKGNTDFNDYSTKNEIILDIENHKFFLSHGHIYGVKGGYAKILSTAKKKKVDIVIFGHTHYKDYYEEDGIILFNPGAAMDGDYGVILIENENITFEHKSLRKEYVKF